MTTGRQQTPQRLIDDLIRTAALFHQRGWMWGTSGNLSVKLHSSPLTIAVTGSGASKGELTYRDIAVVPEERRRTFPFLGAATPEPSSETSIHLAVYEALPETGAVYHVHTVPSTLLSLTAAGKGRRGALVIKDLEMLKGWAIPWRTGTLTARVPVLANRPDMKELAQETRSLLQKGKTAPVLLIAGHGMTAWGRTPQEAQDRLEIAEFVFQVLWELSKVHRVR
jgi:methylthioribulose-1-phosphate dehydratase